MQSINIFDILGIFGSLIISFAYFYSQYKDTFLNSKAFFIGNILGSGLIILSLIYSSFNISSFFIEVLWISVSIYGLIKYKYKNRNKMFNGTIYQDELSIDNQKTIFNERYFTKDDLGNNIFFKNPISGEVVPEKSGYLNTFLFNGTTMLTPSAISKSSLNINNLNKELFSKKFNLLILDLSENIEYSIDYFKKNIKENKNLVLFFKTNYIDLSEVENGIPTNEFFNKKRLMLSKDAVKYIGSLDFVKVIIIDGISFETDESKKEGMTNTFNLMSITENNFKPLIYHSKTPIKDYKKISIRIGNVPRNISLPGYPVELFLF